MTTVKSSSSSSGNNGDRNVRDLFGKWENRASTSDAPDIARIAEGFHHSSTLDYRHSVTGTSVTTKRLKKPIKKTTNNNTEKKSTRKPFKIWISLSALVSSRANWM